MKMPIYKLKDGKYSKEYVSLDQNYFNLPLRRDIVHNAFVYYRNYQRVTTHMTKTKGTAAGSGKKPFPQKGRGAARQGNKRSPHLHGGGKAHGRVPRDFTTDINGKYLSKAFKTTLSALLYENRLVFIDSEKLDTIKTKFLAGIMRNFENQKLLFVTPMSPCENFKLASQNIQNMRVVNASEFNVKNAIKSDFVFISKQALQELEMLIDGRDHFLTSLRSQLLEHHPANQILGYREGRKLDWFDHATNELQDFEFDPEQETQIHSKALDGYLEKAIEYAEKRDEIYKDEQPLYVNRKSF